MGYLIIVGRYDPNFNKQLNYSISYLIYKLEDKIRHSITHTIKFLLPIFLIQGPLKNLAWLNIFQKSDKLKSELLKSNSKEGNEDKKHEKMLTTNNDPLQENLSGKSSNKAADYYVKGDVDVRSLKQRKSFQEQE